MHSQKQEQFDLPLTKAFAADFQKNINHHAKRLFQTGWDGYALIQTPDDKYVLKLYSREAYHADWADVHNQVYGTVLSSDSCERVIYRGQPVAVPATLANILYAKMTEDIIHDQICCHIERLESHEPDVFLPFGLTGEQILSDENMLSCMTAAYQNTDDEKTPYERRNLAVFSVLQDAAKSGDGHDA